MKRPNRFYITNAIIALAVLLISACGGTGNGDNDQSKSATSSGSPASLRLLAGDLGSYGNVDGNGADARFTSPLAVAVDAAGSVYVTDSDNYTIRRIATDGSVTTVAGETQESGTANGPGDLARFVYPQALLAHPDGNLYIGDETSIRMLTASGQVSTYTGNPAQGGYADGDLASAAFDGASGMALDSAGNLYIADQYNHVIRMIDGAGNVTTVAGTPGVNGWQDGDGASALFNYPTDIAIDDADNIYVADIVNRVIRRITRSQANTTVSTLAGLHGVAGYADGSGDNARFEDPAGIAFYAGILYVTDRGNHVIRRISLAGDVTTYAGSGGQQGYADGIGNAARFNYPSGIAADGAGNLVVSQYGDHTIRHIAPAAVVTTLAGAAERSGHLDAVGDEARFRIPHGLAADADGNVYVSENSGGSVRMIDDAGSVTTLMTLGTTAGRLARDDFGNLYIASSYQHIIVKRDASGIESVYAGTGSPGSADGNAASASFDTPGGVALDAYGNLYVADTGNHTVRRITPGGDVTTIAGSAGQSGAVDGNGGNARFSYPQDLVCDAAGRLYVADANNDAIRRIDPNGDVTVFAGMMRQGGAQDGPAASARFSYPGGLDLDGAGNLYVADFENHAIRRITPGGTVSTVVGAFGKVGAQPGSLPASLYAPRDVVLRADGELVIATANGVMVTRNYP